MTTTNTSALVIRPSEHMTLRRSSDSEGRHGRATAGSAAWSLRHDRTLERSPRHVGLDGLRKTSGAVSHQAPTLDETALDIILADSFPASDPPPWTLGVER
jgi:hypothetical protein